MSRDWFAQEGANRRSTETAAVTVRSLVVTRGVVVMRVNVVGHVMARVMGRLVVGVMNGGRGRRGEHQRGRDDDRQSRDDFTHERLHE